HIVCIWISTRPYLCWDQTTFTFTYYILVSSVFLQLDYNDVQFSTQLVAHDPDSTAQLVYSMGSSAEVAVMSATFNVESSGVVRLRSFLNFELRHTYKVPIRVNDGEFTAQSSLFVHVLDVNDEPPEFEVNPKRLVADENASVGKLIGRVRIQDPDSEAVNGKVECWEPEDLRRHQVLSFLPDPMSNPSASVYDLTTRVVLDREAFSGPQLGRLFVYLVCSDGNGLTNENRPGVKHTATMTATLMVRDVNDHPPVFSQSVYHVAVRENNLLGEKIIQVKATDADEGDNAKISYSLLDRANFKVDSLTGWITANVIFDRETRDSYQVTVVANDHGKERLSSSVLLNLTILDVNDHRPHLLPCEGELPIIDRAHLQTGRIGDRNLFAIQENLPGNTHIGDLLAKDDDIGPNAQLHFELAKETPLPYLTQFRLLHNGSLYTNRELDREEKEYYRLAVRVTDLSPTDPLSSTGTISIIVLDVNDNAPNFVQPSGLLRVGFDRPVVEDDSGSNILYDQPQLQNEVSSPDPLTSSNPKPTVLLSVREKPGHLITKLYAKDPDTGPNGYIRYTLAEFADSSTDFGSGSKANSICRVTHDSGNVVLQRHLTVSDLGMHYFKVAAIDDGYPTPLKDTKILAVLVKDIPAVGSEPTNSLSSSYYSNNRTRFELELWGFEGKSNLFIITVLASVSGLLASVLVTAIVCVSGPCSKNRSGFCSRRRRQRPGQRPVTSPGCSETGNGFILGSPGQNGNGGGLGHYGLPSFHEETFSDLPPRGVNPGSLLQEEWQLSCGRDSCHGYGNGNLMNFPHRQAHSMVSSASPASAQRLLSAADDPGINPPFLSKGLHSAGDSVHLGSYLLNSNCQLFPQQILRIDQSDTVAKNYENLGHLLHWSEVSTGDDERTRDSVPGNTHTLIPNAGVYGSLISKPRSFPLGQNDTGHETFPQSPQPLSLSGVHTFCVAKPTAVTPLSFCITENPTMKMGPVAPEAQKSHFYPTNAEGSRQTSNSMNDGRTFDTSQLRAKYEYRKTPGAVFSTYETELQQQLQLSVSKLEEQTSDSGHGGSEEDDHAQSGELRQWKTWQPIRIQCSPSNANSTYDPKQPTPSCSPDPRVDFKCVLTSKGENNRETLQRP
ncbi:cadherin domain protein, partial [Opisthorchis viverrini]